MIDYKYQIAMLFGKPYPVIYIKKYKILEELLNSGRGRESKKLATILSQIILVENGETESQMNGTEAVSIKITGEECILHDNFYDKMEEDALEDLTLPLPEVKEIIQTWIEKRKKLFQKIDDTTKQKVEGMLQNMKKHNGVYLAKKSITLLAPYIDGYCHSMNDYFGETLDFNDGFNQYLRKKYPTLFEMPYWNWDIAILNKSNSEEKAFEEFFDFLADYWEKEV